MTITLDKLSDEQRVAISRAARIELAKRSAAVGDILGWGAALFPDKFELGFCAELHGYLVKIREEEMTNTEAPRNHAKTTIKCFLVPLYQALNEPRKFRHYLNIQATDKKALAVNVAIRSELEQNEELREIYGDQVGKDKWSDQQFVLKNGVIFTAASAGQSIRGLNYRNFRPDYIIVDDLYDEEDINNPDSTRKKNDWFWGTLYPIRAKGRRCSIHVQGTAINSEDILEVLKRKKRWKSRTFAAIKDFKRKIVLWKELNSFASLMDDMKDMPIVIFMREMQNERRDDKTAIVKRTWLLHWEFDPTDTFRFDLHYQISGSILAIDPSIGKHEENDPSAFVWMLKTQRDDGSLPHYWIMQITNELLSLQGRLDEAKRYERDSGNIHPDRRLTLCRVEGISGFDDFGTLVAQNLSVPTDVIPKVTDKITHLEKKSHYFQNGRVHLNKNIDPELKILIVDQLTTNHPKHDDVRDATLHALEDESGLWRHV